MRQAFSSQHSIGGCFSTGDVIGSLLRRSARSGTPRGAPWWTCRSKPAGCFVRRTNTSSAHALLTYSG